MELVQTKSAWPGIRRGALILGGAIGAALYLWHVFGIWVALVVASAVVLVAPWAEKVIGAGREGSARADDASRQFGAAKAGVVSGLIAGASGICAYSAQFGSVQAFLAIGSGAALVGGASFVTGCLLGFLFGIPRSSANDGKGERGAGEAAGGSGPPAAMVAAVEYRANTNLEQISDWFTKILVGVGLTQLTKVSSLFQSLGEALQPLLGGTASAGRFGVALSVYFAVTGFMVGYLWTRLALGGALRAADLAAIGERTADVENKVHALERQATLDAKALGMISSVLNPGKDTPPTPQEDLDKAVSEASQPVRVQIFYRAEEMRAANWRDAANKPKMARTIPVFRALAASDPEDRYHRNHGQLGYALKDQLQPDWKEAEAELSKAIAIRGDPHDHGWALYEFNRAICRIHLDASFAAKNAAPKEVKTEVVRDLRVAMKLGLQDLMVAEPTLSEWLQVNQLSETDLR
jgi:hypothetical protein